MDVRGRSSRRDWRSRQRSARSPEASSRARSRLPSAKTAAVRASASDTPSATRSLSTQDSSRGAKRICWQRERIVGSRTAAFVATSTRVVQPGGSSRVLSSAFCASTVMRSASSTMPILRGPRTGRSPRWPRTRRTCSIDTCDAPARSACARSRSSMKRSGCDPASTSRHSLHEPQPEPGSRSQRQARASARAVVRFPTPGGPEKT